MGLTRFTLAALYANSSVPTPFSLWGIFNFCLANFMDIVCVRGGFCKFLIKAKVSTGMLRMFPVARTGSNVLGANELPLLAFCKLLQFILFSFPS